MTVTVTSDDSYVIRIDNSGSGGRALRVVWGSSGSEVWTLAQSGVLTLTGDLIFKAPAHLNQRVTSGAAFEFADSSGVLVTLEADGRWVCSDTGLALDTLGACPSSGAVNGMTHVLHDTSPTLYAVVGRVDGAWRKVTLS